MRGLTIGGFILALLIVIGIMSCSSGGAQRSGEVILNGTLVYPDTTIVDDRIVNVKLNPGPDTVRVGGGQFRLTAPYRGEYQVILKYPERAAFPPLMISLENGSNRLSFMIPREEQIEMIPGEREEDRAGEDTRIIIIRP